MNQSLKHEKPFHLPDAGWVTRNRFIHKISSTNSLDQLNATGGVAVKFEPVPRTKSNLQITGVQGRTVCLFDSRSPTGFRTRPILEADVCTVRFVTNGYMKRVNLNDALTVSKDFATFSSLPDMQRSEASAGFSSISATITKTLLIKLNRTLVGEEEPLPNLIPLVSVNKLSLIALRQCLEQLHYRLVQLNAPNDLFLPMLEEIFVYQLLSSWPRKARNDEYNPIFFHNNMTKRAIEYIEANIGSPITLSEVAAASGVSVRTLQIEFKNEIGQTPSSFIIERRLLRAHKDLCDSTCSNETISQLARRWGFIHISDFSQRYRKRFGCTPTETRHYSGTK